MKAKVTQSQIRKLETIIGKLEQLRVTLTARARERQMSDTKHTPGPWALVNERLICTANTDGSIPLNSKVVAEFTAIRREAPSAKADRILIAAAPSLFEALEEIEMLAEGLHGIQTNAKGAAENLATKKQILSRTRAAIALAKGESE